ncbi:hypothetical protein DFH06DRAFT_974911, partial [Mycena polygramma]
MIPHSPFSSKLNTNYVPSESEPREIRELLKRPQRDLQRLEMEIATLIQRRDDLKDFIDAHMALLSPVRALPEDILGEIFVASLPDPRGIDVRASPLLLCQICMAWRVLAFSMPRLWDHIHPEFNERWELTDFAETFWGAWLDRSGARPLTIRTTLSLKCTETNNFAPLLTLLIDQDRSRRWKHLYLELPNWQDSLIPLNNLGPDDVPLLQSVSVAVHETHSWSVSHLDPISLGFLRTDSLRELTIPNTLLHITNHPIQWTKLKTLRIMRHRSAVLQDFLSIPTFGDALDILHRCSELESCTLDL